MSFQHRWFRVVLASMILAVCGHATAQQVVEQKQTRQRFATADFVNVQRSVEQAVGKHTAANVLVVVDIDNTLLAMNQDLGSDQWFHWQEDLLKNDPNSDQLVGKDFSGLLSVQGMIFSLSAMHPPEPELPAIVAAIQELGVVTIVLTSRGPEFRDAAERELKRNGFAFSKSLLQIKEGNRGLFQPYDASKPGVHGLSATEMANLGAPRPVTYANGIYMTAGQHKGYMLKTLVARSDRKFKAIVFADDHSKHTDRMHDAFANDPVDLITIRYAREDGNVSKFQKSSKRHVVDAWNRLNQAIESVMIK